MKLVQAKELTNKDLIGKSDPFVVIFVRPLRDRMKTSKTIVCKLAFLLAFSNFQSQLEYFSLYVQNNELNPIWNEHFEFTVEDASTQHLTVRVFDDEGPMLAPEIIGIAQIALKELEPGKVKDVWLKLVKDVKVQRDTKNRGQVRMPTD